MSEATACPASISSCTAASRYWPGRERLTELTGLFQAQISARVNFTVQTNGTLLRRPMLETLSELRIRVGVSLDGDAEATGRHRLYPSGRNSYDDVAAGLRSRVARVP